MKVIIAGSRDVPNVETVRAALRDAGLTPAKVTEVVSGTCRGADKFGEAVARAHGIPIKPFPANWRPNGVLDRSAGYKRNAKMAEYGDMLVAIWDGRSRGTASMIDLMHEQGKPVHVYRFK